MICEHCDNDGSICNCDVSYVITCMHIIANMVVSSGAHVEKSLHCLRSHTKLYTSSIVSSLGTVLCIHVHVSFK